MLPDSTGVFTMEGRRSNCLTLGYKVVHSILRAIRGYRFAVKVAVCKHCHEREQHLRLACLLPLSVTGMTHGRVSVHLQMPHRSIHMHSSPSTYPRSNSEITTNGMAVKGKHHSVSCRISEFNSVHTTCPPSLPVPLRSTPLHSTPAS